MSITTTGPKPPGIGRTIADAAVMAQNATTAARVRRRDLRLSGVKGWSARSRFIRRAARRKGTAPEAMIAPKIVPMIATSNPDPEKRHSAAIVIPQIAKNAAITLASTTIPFVSADRARR